MSFNNVVNDFEASMAQNEEFDENQEQGQCPEVKINNIEDVLTINDLDFVKPIINDNINYRVDQIELIGKAMEISNGDPLNALQYFVACMNHEGYDVEFELVFTIPANTEVTITLPIRDYPGDELGYYVSWNDEITHNTNVHTYKSIDKIKEYHVRFFGLGISGFGRFSYDEDYYGYTKYLTNVISFGILGHTFTSLEYAFVDCKNNFTVPQTLPSSITDTSNMFRFCGAFNQPLNGWNTSNVTNMKSMFLECTSFNQPLNDWSVNNVVNMKDMFHKCANFNQPLNTWSVNNVTTMEEMFYGCANFNQPLDAWSVNNVTNMNNMFMDCTNFNQPLNAWNTSNVTIMSRMFFGCKNFNQPLDAWSVNNVTKMTYMFADCTNFNQPLNTWSVNNVIDMDRMFIRCTNFNQPLNAWSVNNAKDMKLMFADCISFNQPLNAWNTSNVTDTYKMFAGCTNFNQPLNAWNVSNVIDMTAMFENCNISEENKPIF